MAAEVLAAAFSDDPVFSWLFADPARRRAGLEAFFGVCAHASFRRGHLFVASGAAAAWSPPDVRLLDRESGAALAALVGEYEGEEGLARLMALAEATEDHPTEPHYYLGFVGVEPGAQGQGRGARLLQPMLATCDDEGYAAYLESSSARNEALYHRLGFRTLQRLPIAGGPSMAAMWREPRP
jgi:GNAT superfamily N-acetyltransferase